MPELNVKVWRRYGKTRVYVSTADAEPRTIGWYDPLTGRHQLDDAELAEPFWAAANAECERLRAAGKLPVIVAPDPPVAPPRAEPEPEPVPAEPEPAPEWHDLATHRPGEGVREHARELRRAHPVGSALARLVGVRTDARSFADGWRGERKVGRALDKYAGRDGWRVLHGVQVSDRGTDIDHVVVGAFGVVTVNTKRTSAAVRVGDHTIWVGGHQVPYLTKSRAEARRAYKRLLATGHDVPVRPALVFVGQQEFQRGHRASGDFQLDVAVLPGAGALRDWINRLPPVLDEIATAALYDAARRAGTWLV